MWHLLVICAEEKNFILGYNVSKIYEIEMAVLI